MRGYTLKVLERKRLKTPIAMRAGDNFRLTWVPLVGSKQVLLTTGVLAAMIVDEVIVVETEFEGRRAILGGVVEEQR